MTHYEPFTAAFNGSLKTFTLKDGRKFVLNGMMHVQKGRAYMMKIDDQNRCTLLPVIIPND